MSESCLYEGIVMHRRLSPQREFRHRLTLAYLDLEELPSLLDGRLLRTRPGALRFRRADYYGDPHTQLTKTVRDGVYAHTGERPQGPIRLLTQLRSFGHCFNPVSFYYCFTPDGSRVEAILAEVTNTPWGERHAYVLHTPAHPARMVDVHFKKALHVSPFMSMDSAYRARASVPAETLSVHIESEGADRVGFAATLSLERRELTRSSARALVARYPFAGVRVLTLIYTRALALKLAGARVYRHPPRAKQA